MVWDPWTDIWKFNVDVIEVPCPTKGLYFPDQPLIVIATGLTRVERRCVLAEELGHHTLGHRASRSLVTTAKRELAAKRWAATRLLTIVDLSKALPGATSITQVAEALDVNRVMLRQRLNDLTVTDHIRLLGLVARRDERV